MGTLAIRGLYLAVTLLFGLMIGTAAGVIAYLGGNPVGEAILTGGAAFAGTAGFVLLIIGFLEVGQDKQK